MVFDVTLTNAWTSEITVNWATSDGTATAGTDYTAGSGTLTSPQGDSTSSWTIRVPILEDTEFEGDETFTIVLSGPAGAGFQGGGETLAVTGTIEDNDLPVVTVEAKTAEVSEGESAVFVLTRTGNASDPLTIRFQYLGGGTNTTRAAYFAEYATIAEVFLDTWEDSVVNYPPDRDFTVELFGDGEYESAARTRSGPPATPPPPPSRPPTTTSWSSSAWRPRHRRWRRWIPARVILMLHICPSSSGAPET